MIKKKGYTYITTLFVVLIIFASISFIINNINTEEQIYSSLTDKIQNQYYGESCANYLFSTEEYNKFNDFVTDKFIKKINQSQYNLDFSYILPEANLEEIRVDIDRNQELPKHITTINTVYKGVTQKTILIGEIVNPLFRTKLGIVNDDIELKEEFQEFRDIFNIDNICNSNFFRENIFYGNEDTYYFNSERNFLHINTRKEYEDNEVVEDNKLITFVTIPVLYKLNYGKYIIENICELKGIVYLKGEIVLDKDLLINGILIIDGGKIISNGGELIVNGMAINFSKADESAISANYNISETLFYSKAIPEMLKINLEVLKKSDQNYFN